MKRPLIFAIGGRRVGMVLSAETIMVLQKVAEKRQTTEEEVAAALPLNELLEQKKELSDRTIREYLEETFLCSGE